MDIINGMEEAEFRLFTELVLRRLSKKPLTENEKEMMEEILAVYNSIII